ncbi:MFS transporter [Mucilaginibacter sp. RS28]|uniref:MFS transporter n=1 Tax=Mucilaginibacter straminoryzae TaxID=2932774 RepID=A0A9X1X284_9SPHI|nr:MFS transporter [Mucilaginibacter straminoryzae]MCJ8209286.1 MFS transporter [Mucilaginibacter straminoryzae]
MSSTFRSLQYPNFRLYFIGQSLSLIGTWMERIAINWVVYSISHSALMLGVVNFSGQLPTLLLSPYGGAMSDRHNRYRILLTTQIAAMIQASIMATLILSKVYSLPAIMCLSVVLGIINAFDTPARQSLMIRLIDDKSDLQNAIALNSSMVNVARLIGPAVAGILLVTVGSGICFLLNAISFLAVIACLLLMKLKPETRPAATDTVWQGLKSGFEYLKQARDIKLIILLMAFTSFFTMTYTTLLPIFAKDIFKGNAGTYSLLNSLSGLGALAGAVYMAGLKSTKNLRHTVVYACMLFSASIAAVALCSKLWVALIFICFSGLGMMTQIAGTNTFIQTTVDNRMRGRVISFYVMAFMGMQPLGSFVVGLAAHHISARHVLLIEGLCGFVAAIVFGLCLKRSAAQQIAHSAEEPAQLIP